MVEQSSWTSHVLAGAAWRRFLFMLIFVPILCCALFLMGFTSLFQFFSMLASGEANPQLTDFGHGLARFSAEIMDYLTYNTEQRPFPFSRWRDDAPRRSARRNRAAPRRKRKARAAARQGAGADKPVAQLHPPREPAPDITPQEGEKPGGARPEEQAP